MPSTPEDILALLVRDPLFQFGRHIGFIIFLLPKAGWKASFNKCYKLDICVEQSFNGTMIILSYAYTPDPKQEISAKHLPGSLSLDFLDFFLPVPVPSAARARGFLWLMYHYLEGPNDNPYDDKYSVTHPGKGPYIFRVDDKTLASENIDTLAEITWGQKMAARRAAFVEKQLEIELLGKEPMPRTRRERKVPAESSWKSLEKHAGKATHVF
jgi:hypothetical protein